MQYKKLFLSNIFIIHPCTKAYSFPNLTKSNTSTLSISDILPKASSIPTSTTLRDCCLIQLKTYWPKRKNTKPGQSRYWQILLTSVLRSLTWTSTKAVSKRNCRNIWNINKTYWEASNQRD